MRGRTAAGLLAGLALVLLLAFSGLGRARTYSTLGMEQRRDLSALPVHPEVPKNPDLVIERYAVIAAKPERIYELLTNAQRWADWDHGITRVAVPARRPLMVGDVFTKVEMGIRVEAQVIEAEHGQLLRWRGKAPMKVVGVHSYQLVPIDSNHTLVVNREEFSNGALRLFGWATDFGLGKRFERTLEGLKAAAESAPRS